MNPSNNLHNQQWDTCERCGAIYPMKYLVNQKGSLVCTVVPCRDDLTIERHAAAVSRILGEGNLTEGVDTRWIERSFFQGDWEHLVG